MAKTEMIHIRVEPALKKSAEAIFAEIGLGMGDAVRMFLTQTARRKEFPLELRVPNKRTQQSIREARERKGVSMSLGEFREYLLGSPKPTVTRKRRKKGS